MHMIFWQFEYIIDYDFFNFRSFHPKKKGIKKSLLNSAAAVIQKWVRGWLIRQRMKELKRKVDIYM